MHLGDKMNSMERKNHLVLSILSLIRQLANSLRTNAPVFPGYFVGHSWLKTVLPICTGWKEENPSLLSWHFEGYSCLITVLPIWQGGRRRTRHFFPYILWDTVDSLLCLMHRVEEGGGEEVVGVSSCVPSWRAKRSISADTTLPSPRPQDFKVCPHLLSL